MLIRLPLWHTRCVRSGLPMNKVILWLVAIFLVGAGAIAEAQQPKKIPRIGYLSTWSPIRVSALCRGVSPGFARARLCRRKEHLALSIDMRREKLNGFRVLRRSLCI